MQAIKVEARLSEINKIRAFLKKSLENFSLSDENFYTIELSLLEICVNIIRYAYPEKKGDIHIRIWNERGKILFEIIDDGIPFDPKRITDPDLPKMISGKKKGGLGIFLARRLMDELDYKREEGKNIVTLIKLI